MIMWGTGFFQSDRDLAIAKDLFQMLGRGLVSLEEWKITEDTVKRLNSGLLAENFDKVLSAHFKPHNSRHKREYVAVILGMIAMDFGARIEDRHMKALRLLRPWLPTIDMQLQLVTALDEYKNDGTAWKLERKCPKQLAASSKKDSTEYDLEFWITGVGSSIDDIPTSETSSKSCLECGDRNPRLLRCARCKLARYCNSSCQRNDWSVHKRVCHRPPNDHS